MEQTSATAHRIDRHSTLITSMLRHHEQLNSTLSSSAEGPLSRAEVVFVTVSPFGALVESKLARRLEQCSDRDTDRASIRRRTGPSAICGASVRDRVRRRSSTSPADNSRRSGRGTNRRWYSCRKCNQLRGRDAQHQFGSPIRPNPAVAPAVRWPTSARQCENPHGSSQLITPLSVRWRLQATAARRFCQGARKTGQRRARENQPF